MNNLNKSWIVFIAVIFLAVTYNSCKTTQPVVTSIPRENDKDTVLVSPVIVTAPIATVEIPKVVHDTVYTERTIKYESSGLDTAKLYSYLEQYHGYKSQQMAALETTIMTLQSTIHNLEGIIAHTVVKQDSVQVKLDTSRQIVKQAKQLIAVNNTMLFDVPTTMYMIIFVIFISSFVAYHLTKRRLKGKWPYSKKEKFTQVST